MKTLFKIPVTWQEEGIMTIEAETIEEALEIAEETELPYYDFDFIDGSIVLPDKYNNTLRMLNTHYDWRNVK